MEISFDFPHVPKDIIISNKTQLIYCHVVSWKFLIRQFPHDNMIVAITFGLRIHKELETL